MAEAGERAAAIFAADKVSKGAGVRLRISRGGFGEADRARIEHYEQSYAMLAELIPGHHLVDRLRLELQALPIS